MKAVTKVISANASDSTNQSYTVPEGRRLICKIHADAGASTVRIITPDSDGTSSTMRIDLNLDSFEKRDLVLAENVVVQGLSSGDYFLISGYLEDDV